MIDVSCKALVRRVIDDLDVIYKASNDDVDVIRKASVRRVTDDVAVICKASVRRVTDDVDVSCKASVRRDSGDSRCETHWTQKEVNEGRQCSGRAVPWHWNSGLAGKRYLFQVIGARPLALLESASSFFKSCWIHGRSICASSSSRAQVIDARHSEVL